jgi:hypothetical protein
MSGACGDRKGAARDDLKVHGDHGACEDRKAGERCPQ